MGAVVLHMPIALDAHQDARRIRRADRERRVPLEPPQPEMLRMDESLSRAGFVVSITGVTGPTAPCAKSMQAIA